MTQAPQTVVIGASLVIAALLPLTASAGEVSLSGEGSVQYTPDSARLQFTASAEHPLAESASDQLARTMHQWRDGIDNYRDQLNDYSDANTSLYTRSLPADDNQKRKTVAVATQTISFTIDDLDLLNPLLAQARSAGLQYNINPRQFFHSDQRKLEKQALANAIDDARDRCQFVAQQLEKTCGDVTTINVNGARQPVTMMRAEAKTASASDTIASIGPREINASVSATFALD